MGLHSDGPLAGWELGREEWEEEVEPEPRGKEL